MQGKHAWRQEDWVGIVVTEAGNNVGLNSSRCIRDAEKDEFERHKVGCSNGPWWGPKSSEWLSVLVSGGEIGKEKACWKKMTSTG